MIRQHSDDLLSSNHCQLNKIFDVTSWHLLCVSYLAYNFRFSSCCKQDITHDGKIFRHGINVWQSNHTWYGKDDHFSMQIWLVACRL